MDIHKPKPWQGVREFLKEYLIIVIGVLTALAFESGVEWLHWRHQVTETEAALLPEVRINLLNSYERIVDRVCLTRRIAELRDQLLQPGPDWKAAGLAPPGDGVPLDLEALASPSSQIGNGAIPVLYRPPHRPWGEGVWTAALSGGVINHMSRERALQYSSLFRAFEQMKQAQDLEEAARARLSPLAFGRHLTEPEKTQYLAVLGDLNAGNERLSGLGAQIIKMGDRAGLRIKASDARQRLAGIATFRADCYQPVAIPLAPG